jgi:hypothetical protein
LVVVRRFRAREVAGEVAGGGEAGVRVKKHP